MLRYPPFSLRNKILESVPGEVDIHLVVVECVPAHP